MDAFEDPGVSDRHFGGGHGLAAPRQAGRGRRPLAFDSDGNLFAGGIAFNRVNPQNGDVWVATYGAQPHPSGYPKGTTCGPSSSGREPRL